MKKIALLIAGMIAILSVQQGFAADSSFSAEQKSQIETVVHDYLVNNPKVLVEASRALQMQQREEMMKNAEQAIKDSRKDLFDDHNAFSGNEKGDVTLVEFFDYKCIHCKRMAPVIRELTENDPNLKIVYKQLPIFGGESHYAAKAALAAANQKNFKEFHYGLLEAKGNLTKKNVVKIAKQAGINLKQLTKDIQDPKIEQIIDENMKLAQKIGIMGTPAFIIASNIDDNEKFASFFMPGATQKPTLVAMIEKARKAKSA